MVCQGGCHLGLFISSFTVPQCPLSLTQLEKNSDHFLSLSLAHTHTQHTCTSMLTHTHTHTFLLLFWVQVVSVWQSCLWSCSGCCLWVEVLRITRDTQSGWVNFVYCLLHNASFFVFVWYYCAILGQNKGPLVCKGATVNVSRWGGYCCQDVIVVISEVWLLPLSFCDCSISVIDCCHYQDEIVTIV